MTQPTVTDRVIINLLIIAIGYLLKRASIISREDGRVLSRVVLYVTLPATSLRVIANTAISWDLLLLPIIVFVVAVVTCLIGFIPARALKLSGADLGTFAVSLCGFMASLAYPFLEAAYGDAGVRALALCDLGNALAIFGVAYYLSFRYATNGHFSMAEVLQKIGTFPPLYAFVGGLVLSVLGIVPQGIPGELLKTLAAANSPMILLALGVYLEIAISREEGKIIAVNMVYKYGLGVIVALFFLLVLPYRGPIRAALFLLPLMPTSFSTMAYAAEQGLNARLAAILVSLSMGISLTIITIAMVGFRGAF
jgi:hypothetical protein